MDCVDKPQNYKDLYGILQLLRGSHLNNFQLKTLKLGWVALHSVTFQLKCLDFQSNRYKKLVPVLSRFCNTSEITGSPSSLYEPHKEHNMTSNYKGLYGIFYKISTRVVKNENIQEKWLTLFLTWVVYSWCRYFTDLT